MKTLVDCVFILELCRPDRSNTKDRDLDPVVAGGFSDVFEKSWVVKTAPDLFLDEIDHRARGHSVVTVKLSGQKIGSARKMGPLKIRSTRKPRHDSKSKEELPPAVVVYCTFCKNCRATKKPVVVP